MSVWKDKAEKILAAIAFAEAGEHQTALAMTGSRPTQRQPDFHRLMAAITFAEADCPETARAFLDPLGPKKPTGPRLSDFLTEIGLGEAKCFYGLARITI